MKKLLFGIAALSLLAACSGKTENSSATENMEQVSLDTNSADSVSEVNNTDYNLPDTASAIPTVDQPSSQANVEKKENSGSEYGSLVSQFVSAVNKYDSNMKKEKWQEGEKWRDKANSLFFKIEKIKGKLTPEERKKYNNASKKFNRLADKWQ